MGDDEWDTAVEGWKAEFEAMTLPELIASFGPLADGGTLDNDPSQQLSHGWDEEADDACPCPCPCHFAAQLGIPPEDA
jgi:hypothetical protein